MLDPCRTGGVETSRPLGEWPGPTITGPHPNLSGVQPACCWRGIHELYPDPQSDAEYMLLVVFKINRNVYMFETSPYVTLSVDEHITIQVEVFTNMINEDVTHITGRTSLNKFQLDGFSLLRTNFILIVKDCCFSLMIFSSERCFLVQSV
jgi:hypothetical protein